MRQLSDSSVWLGIVLSNCIAKTEIKILFLKLSFVKFDSYLGHWYGDFRRNSLFGTLFVQFDNFKNVIKPQLFIQNFQAKNFTIDEVF